ncbi:MULTISPECIES: AfsR/SARP family transcriptional regulator [Micromonospora]|uniref:BTAD domain-containing putative transcriptional regulator n=1 Tax=Micromonospora sicca TaxID=2202420 RepID=A0ABU5J7P3_9ACTN|nr:MULTISPECIES: AfsR/SARP family transcriptional regulator [unclassified Micromonospora]MDZ5444690.1 BTAD domain-containing putative transcriptional regulator [Micromonospora sp. 4G57]MDZ5488509.1 BTAD domain-containing putative transcriptional regulator [Micromonospora sp. 4G53]
MSGTLRFELLGPQRAWYADRELDLGPGKQRAVLAVLLLSAGRPVPTGQIVEAVWPDEPPANGTNVVQKYVAGLRRVLEPDRSPRTPGQVLSLTDAGYLLRVAPESVDAVGFERGVHRARQGHAAGRTADALAQVTAALELWQGEPFTGFAGLVFEAARHRLVELRAVALETRAELALDLGRHRELVGELVELVAEFPVRERLRHQLMLALYRSGRQAEALAAYREFGDLLRDDYGIEPGEALRELHRRILRSDPALTPNSSRSGPPTPRTDPATATEGPLPAEQPAPSPERTTGGSEHPTVAPGPRAAQPPGRSLPAPPEPVAAARVASVGGPGVAVGPVSPAAARPWEAPPPATPASPWPPAQGGWPAATRQPGPLVGLHQPTGEWTEQRSPGWVRVVATVTGTAVALLSFGMLTWAVVLGYALWRRSRRLALAGVGYFLLVVSMFAIALQEVPDNEELPDSEFLYLIGAMAFCWLVGAGHVLLLNPALWSGVTRLFWTDRQRVAEQQRVRREQARYLLHHYPAARHELYIGRPDLPRTFDDGGLVDVNTVPDQVLVALPGLTGEQRRQIAVDRWRRGPYGSLEELTGRCQLPPAATEPLRDLLLFLPPAPPPPGPHDPGYRPGAW